MIATFYNQFGIDINPTADPENPFKPSTPQGLEHNPYTDEFKKEYEGFKAKHPEVAEYDSALILATEVNFRPESPSQTDYILYLYKKKPETKVEVNSADEVIYAHEYLRVNREQDYVELKNVDNFCSIRIGVAFNQKANQHTCATASPFEFHQGFAVNRINPVGMQCLIYSTDSPFAPSGKVYDWLGGTLGKAEGYKAVIIYQQLLPLIPKLRREFGSKFVRFYGTKKFFIRGTYKGTDTAFIFNKYEIVDNRILKLSDTHMWVKDTEQCWYEKVGVSPDAGQFASIELLKTDFNDLLTNSTDLVNKLKAGGWTAKLFDGFPASWKKNLFVFDTPYYLIIEDTNITDVRILNPITSANLTTDNIPVSGATFRWNKNKSTKWEFYNVSSSTSIKKESKSTMYTSHKGIAKFCKANGWKNVNDQSTCLKGSSDKIVGDLFAGDFVDADSSNKDSTLADDIKDLLDKEGKTFYLLGKPKGSDLPKLYLFDLGQVLGGLQYTHIKDAVVYKQEQCKWVREGVSDIKFSNLIGEVDTNFYLLTPDKLVQPHTISLITQRKANEYLLKHFPTCSIDRPEGGENPNENLKPDFGGGGSGGQGGIGGSGQDGFFPEHNYPLPKPEVPPCGDDPDAGSQAPVSRIYLLSVPELTPSFDDTYDFVSKEAQERFFTSKQSFELGNYSYLRKESAIQIGSHVDNIHCYNYLMYKNKYNKWYYCFIMDKQYINERTTKLIIATDVIQTYLFDYVLAPCFVERCHVHRWNKDGTPTLEYEPEGLEFGEPIQEDVYTLDYKFDDTYIAVCSNPLGIIPSRSALKKAEEKPKGVDENGTTI